MKCSRETTITIKYPPMRALRLISKCQKNQDFIKLIELNELTYLGNLKISCNALLKILN